MAIEQQVKTFRTDYTNKGRPETIIAEVRHDDRCGNGHNTFSITGIIYTTDRQIGEGTIRHSDGRALWAASRGRIHEDIAKRIPTLAPYIKWHLCSTDGPLHYIANTAYHADDRDCWGLRKSEFRAFTDKETGLPEWRLKADSAYATSGEGKERDLEAARHCAIWPEATDAELTDPGLADRLKARLPALLVEFQVAVESLGLVY